VADDALAPFQRRRGSGPNSRAGCAPALAEIRPSSFVATRAVSVNCLSGTAPLASLIGFSLSRSWQRTRIVLVVAPATARRWGPFTLLSARPVESDAPLRIDEDCPDRSAYGKYATAPIRRHHRAILRSTELLRESIVVVSGGFKPGCHNAAFLRSRRHRGQTCDRLRAAGVLPASDSVHSTFVLSIFLARGAAPDCGLKYRHHRLPLFIRDGRRRNGRGPLRGRARARRRPVGRAGSASAGGSRRECRSGSGSRRRV
jgi:hypothetical protein